MRGRPGCPTEQEKNSVGATFGPPFSASTRKGWVQGRPLIRPSVRTGAPSPRGEGFGRWEVLFPSEKPPFPARPAGGRAVTGVRYRAAGQAEKREDPLQGPKNQSRESRGEKLSPLALFPPVSREKRGPPPGRRPTGRCAPRQVKAPTTRRVHSTAPFPCPVPGGNPRGRSGPAMVPTEPPTDGAAPQGRSKGQGLPAPSPRQ